MLNMKQVAALNALAAVLPVTMLEFTDEDGTVHVALPAGTGWMVDPPSAPDSPEGI